MDQTIIDIITMTVGASGAFLYLSRYSPKELSQMFWDSNPYATKAQIINGSLAALYAALGLIAFVAQLLRFIFEDQIPERAYGTQAYVLVALASVLLMATLTHVTRHLSRLLWLPRMVKGHREMYDAVEQVIRNDGLRDEQLRNQHPGKEQVERQLKEASHRLEQIETLLEVRVTPGATLQERLEEVRPIFEAKSATPHSTQSL